MITIVIGTNRPGSNTANVARAIEAIHRAAGREVAVVDLAELPPALFAPESYAKKPAAFRPFVDRILAASGLVIVTPEYNGGMPGVLKYFIDMLPFPESFEGRPVCFVGVAAGRWGALRPVEQLQAVFGYRNAHLFPERVFVPGVGDVIDDDGRLVDEALLARLTAQAEGFAGFARRLSAGGA